MAVGNDTAMENKMSDAEVKQKLAELSMRGERLSKNIQKLQAALTAGGWDDKAIPKNGRDAKYSQT